MIRLRNVVLIADYIKGIKRRPDCMKVYFTDNTAKCFYKELEKKLLEKFITDYKFIEIDNCSFNPYNIKGFELAEDIYTEDKYVKIYFPDNTATKTNLDDDGFEELVDWFNSWKKEENG